MAEKRMFSKTVINSDDFLELPDSSQNLYFHLSMNADDDGFVGNYKSIMKMTEKKECDLNKLIDKSFIIPFETGVIVIRHWRLNNYIRKDRYKETMYKAEKSLISTDNSLVYQMDTNGQPSIDKNRLDKISIDKNNNANDSCVDGLQEVIEFYEKNIGLITPFGINILTDYLQEMPKELVLLAMKKAVEADKRTIQYIKGILNNWNKKGIKTLLEAKKEDEDFKKSKEKTNKKTHSSKYKQRDYSDFDFTSLYANN